MARPTRDFRINSSTSTRAVMLTAKMIRSTCPTLAPKRLIDSLEKFTGYTRNRLLKLMMIRFSHMVEIPRPVISR